MRGSSLTQFTFEYSVGMVSERQKFSIVTSDSDSDAYTYSMLLKINVESKYHTKVYKDGILIAENVTSYSYTNPVFYLLVLLPFMVVVVIYLLYKEMKKK